MNFHDRVIQWARERNLIEGATPIAQFTKLVEELGEMGEDAADSIGDASVVLTIMCGQIGYTEEHLNKAIEAAHGPDELVFALGQLAGKLARKQPCLHEIAVLFLDLKFTAEALRLNYKECCEIAWEEIKDRKGQMVDGVFVKEADL